MINFWSASSLGTRCQRNRVFSSFFRRIPRLILKRTVISRRDHRLMTRKGVVFNQGSYKFGNSPKAFVGWIGYVAPLSILFISSTQNFLDTKTFIANEKINNLYYRKETLASENWDINSFPKELNRKYLHMLKLMPITKSIKLN